MKLKQINPNLKILISVGGWLAKSTPFNRILLTDYRRAQFIENALNFLRHFRFDGLGKRLSITFKKYFHHTSTIFLQIIFRFRILFLI